MLFRVYLNIYNMGGDVFGKLNKSMNVHIVWGNERNKVDRIKQGYNPSLAVLRLSKTYSEARLETACEFAITRGIKKPRYHHLKSILAANQDKVYSITGLTYGIR